MSQALDQESHGAGEQETLALLESRLAAMEASSDGIGIVDAQGRVSYMNKALKDLYGISDVESEDYIGLRWGQFYTEDGRAQIEDKILPMLERDGHWRGENIVVRKDGQQVRTELSLTYLSDGGFIGAARDMSARELAEREKKELQDQFFQAQKMEAIGRLAGGIAHDFNNILAAMNGYAEFLVDDLEEGTPQWQFAQNILQAGVEARDLVDQMLTFSRHKDSEHQVVDITKPIEKSLSMLQATLPKTIELTQEIKAKTPFIEGNESQIGQTIMNLCVNAVDAIQHEHGELCIGLDEIMGGDIPFSGMIVEQVEYSDGVPPTKIEDITATQTRLSLGLVERDKPYVCLSVMDTGSGMARAVMEHVFEPFFTTKPVDKGTGLGLATVHGMILAHHGAMVIDSTLNVGTAFYLYFPIAEAVLADDHEIKNEDLRPQLGGTILLVEDQAAVRDMMTTMLERLSFDVFSAEDGMEGLQILRENPGAFDLVITDQNMPRMNGLEMVQQAHVDFPDLRFIMLSGYSQEKLKTLIEQHDAIKGMLKKPVTKDVLGHTVQAVLSQKPQEI